jgi:glycolate oxidase
VTDLLEQLRSAVGPANVVDGDDIHDDYTHDEALGATWQRPLAIVRPGDAAEVEAVVRIARATATPLTARGSGTGLSGACIPHPDGILVSFERMNAIKEIDLDNHVAVVEPGVTLAQLDAALAEHGLIYPVFPGEYSASLGGNVATNAGGMRAVKYGVTRHQVLGLEAVLGTGETVRTGGKFVKSTTGYELTQLILGSEGTLAIVTEAILRVYPRLEHVTTVLAPFPTLSDVTEAVPRIVQSGVGPMILEYIDFISLDSMLRAAGLDLGVPPEVREKALAYLVVVLEQRRADRLEEDVAELAELVADRGALDVYVLPPQAGARLIEARERAFFVAKAAGANDIIDTVVPRAALADYLADVAKLGQESGSIVTGCGHAGDGNVHLSVFQPDDAKRRELMHGIYRACSSFGGAVSGEHGIGTAKQPYFLELEDPAKLALYSRIKEAFDPDGILNPGVMLPGAVAAGARVEAGSAL